MPLAGEGNLHWLLTVGPHARGLTVFQSRRGYTLTEMLIVVVVVGSLTLFSLPKFSGLVERNKLSAAREEITAAIATARAAAIQKGRTATFALSGNKISVTVVTSESGTTATVVPQKNLGTLYNVTVGSPADTAITFDMRGFANPRLAGVTKYVISAGARRDSICVTTAGQIMPRTCSL